jgi:hypothetical protein
MVGVRALEFEREWNAQARLKNLQRFRERDVCILLATDVAARGLDIKGIQHVIHYQMPRDPETWVTSCVLGLAVLDVACGGCSFDRFDVAARGSVVHWRVRSSLGRMLTSPR